MGVGKVPLPLRGEDRGEGDVFLLMNSLVAVARELNSRIKSPLLSKTSLKRGLKG